MAAILTVDDKADAEPGYVTQARNRERRLEVALDRVLTAPGHIFSL